jgi:uncharacterized protein (DUF2141 family)
MRARKRHRWIVEIFFIAAPWGFCGWMAAQAAPQSAVQAHVTISGRVIGGAGKHTIRVALWDATGFLHKPVQQIEIKPQGEAVFHFEVTSGEWALSAYKDVNENGVLDMGVFGPREPSGFWRAFHKWRKPEFADVSVTVDKDVTNASIELQK